MNFSKESLKGVAELIILQTLNDLGEGYGYQLVKAIAQNSEDIFELQEGTLYPILYRLEDRGLVSSKIKLAPNGKERRYYSVTKKGNSLLKEKTIEYRALIKGLSSLLRLNQS